MGMQLASVLQYNHQVLQQHLQAGDWALDGTAGNGHDTLHLAQCVGETGQVWAFDIQATALEATRQRLQAANMQACVQLIHAGHEQAADYVPQGIRAAVFNFGYLPSGDKTITTQAHTSLAALQVALDLLAVGGLLSAMVYSGHSAGALEAEQITQWASTLVQTHYRVLRYQFINQRNAPPFLLLIEKIA